MVFELKHEGITIYQKHIINMEFEIIGLTLDKRPDVMYTFERYYSDTDKQVIYLPDMLKELVLSRAKQQLHTFIGANKYRHEIYNNEEDRRDIYENLSRLRLDSDTGLSLCYTYEEILNGVISIQLNHFPFSYNILTGKFESRYPFYYMAYKNRLRYMIAAAQIENGIAPPALMELSNIHKFLADKQRATFVMIDESEYVLKGSELDIFYKTKVHSDELSLSNGYCGNLYYHNIEYIKYGKSEKYYPDKEKLKCLAEPENTNILEFWRKAS